MSDSYPSLNRLARAARSAALRLRIDAAVRRAALLLPLPLLYAVVALTWIKVRRLPHDAVGTLLLVGAVPLLVFVAGVLQAAFTPRARHHGAHALDRFHGLSDRITNALEFGAMPPAERSALMEAAIEDAVEKARAISPRRAAPIHLPPELVVSAGLVLGIGLIALFEVRTTRVLPAEKSFQPMVLTGDDVELFRDMGKELEQKSDDPEALAAARRFNQLIEDIAQRRLDRREVFQRLEQIERELNKGAEADREALEEGLKGLAKELERSDLTKPIAEPLKEKSLADAEKAMRELAEKLKRKREAPNKAELEKLRQALENAAKSNNERLERLEQERKRVEEEKKSLLKKKQPDGGLGEKDKQALEKKDRQLEKLDRDKRQAERAKRKMSDLDKQLSRAAQDLMRDLGDSAKDIENAAQDINRMAKEEMSDEQKKQMLRRIQELREVLRQQGKGGQQRIARMMRFGERARGRSGDEGGQDGNQRGGQQKPGQGQNGNQPGQGQGQGQGAEQLTLGRGDGQNTIPLPGSGQGQKPGQGQGSQGMGQGREGGGDKPGQGAGVGGESWGTGHDSNVKGDKTASQGKTKDVTAAGIDTGQGAASSQVIYGAAQRGFVGKGYKQVYVEYRTVAEQVMNHDEIPPGYRFYVQRYFQLIRPRE